MITKVFTTPETNIKKLLSGEDDFSSSIVGNWALISIYHSPDNPTITSTEDIKKLREKGCRKMLSVCFGDYTDLDYRRYASEYKTTPKHINLITNTQAHTIVRFIKRLQRYDRINTLVVQCKAGISRSGAVGLYACRYYGLDENEYFKSGIIRPNYFIYSKLCEVYNPLQIIQEVTE